MLAGSSSSSSSGRHPAGSGAYPAGSGAYPLASGSSSGRYEDPEIGFGRYLMEQGMINQDQAREAYRLLQGYRQQHPGVNLAQVLAKHNMGQRDALRDAFMAFAASQSGQFQVGSSGSQLVQVPSSQSGALSPIPHTIDPDAQAGGFGSGVIPHTLDPDGPTLPGSGMFGMPPPESETSMFGGGAIPNTIDPDAMIGSGMFSGGAIPNTIDPDGPTLPGGSGMFAGGIPNTIDPDAMGGGPVIPHTMDPDAMHGSGMHGSAQFRPGAIPNTIDPDAMGMPGSAQFRPGAIPNTIDPDAMGGGPVIPHTMDPDAMGGGPVIPHTMDPDGPTMLGSGHHPSGSGFGRPAGSGFGSHGSQFPPGSQGYGSQGPGSQGYGLLPSGSRGPGGSHGPGGTRPDGSRGPHGTQPYGSKGPQGTQKQGTGFQLDLAPAPDKPSPFKNPNLPAPNSLSQVMDEEDEEEEGGTKRKSARRRAAHPALRREPRKPLWIVFVAGLAVVAAVGIGLSVAGSKSRDKRDRERWLNLPDDDARKKLAEGESLPPEVQEDPEVAKQLAALRKTVADEDKKAKALEVLDELEDALTLDERKKICDRALELDTSLAKAWVERARIRFALDRRAAAEKKTKSEPTDITKSARDDLNQAISYDESSPEAHLFSSELYRFENDGRAALGSLRRVEELDPEGALGRLARGLKEENLRRYGDALTHFERAIELNSKLVPAYLALARVHVTQGAYSKAIASADQAKELDPASSEAQSLLAEARYYASGRSDRGVLRILDQALKLDPSNSRALALRAYARLERSKGDRVISSPGECARAIQDAERANQIRPEVVAYMALAEIALWSPEDDKTKAQKLAKKAIDLDARNPDAFLLRARVRVLANTYEEADRDLERVLTLAESRPGTDEVTARALTMRAGIRVLNKDYTAAKDLLKRAIKLNDDLAEAHFYLAKVLHHDPKRQSGDWRVAEKEYSEAISKDGTLADAWFYRGALHIDRSRGEGMVAKEWEEGLDDLKKAEELMNSKYRAFFNPYYLDLMRGLAYYGLEEWPRALKHLKRFVAEASPGEENFAKAKKLIRDIESNHQ